jgi:hypothetical protein
MLDLVSQGVAGAALEDEEIGQAHEWLKHNRPIPHEEVLADLGLSMDDFEKMGCTPLPPEQNAADQ